jgi:hypothetical protein
MGICAVVGLLAVLLVGAVLVPWLGGPGLFDDDLRELGRVLWTEQVREEALVNRERALYQHLTWKEEVVNEVLAGQLTLLEAAERFRAAQGELDDGQDEIIGSFKLVPDEEMCLNVIRWVSCRLSTDPQRQDEVVGRLQKELQRQQKGKGNNSL